MRRTLRQACLRLVLLGLPAAAVLSPAFALAQSAAPTPSLRRSPPVWLGMLVMFVLLAAVTSISLLPSKRGHQD